MPNYILSTKPFSITSALPGDVAVFVCDLARADIAAARYDLSSDELSRADAIAHLGRRNQFVCGRALLRVALRAWGGADASAWTVVDALPAPFVQGPSAPCVSLAHSRDLVVCAVAHAPVGVDIEYRRRRDHDALADAVCAPDELQAYRALAAAERVGRFYSLWVLKEALFKCLRPSSLDAVPAIEFGHEVTCAGAALSLFSPHDDYIGGVALCGAARLRLRLHRAGEGLSVAPR